MSTRSIGRSTATHQNGRSAATREVRRSPATRKNDRSSLCSFTFADGRHCRSPRKAGHTYLCAFHARKEDHALAADQAGQDIARHLSRGYISACDLSSALGRLFAAVAQGHVKSKTAATLAYLGQTLVQTLHLAEHEYVNAFGSDSWRSTVRRSFNPPVVTPAAPAPTRPSTLRPISQPASRPTPQPTPAPQSNPQPSPDATPKPATSPQPSPQPAPRPSPPSSSTPSSPATPTQATAPSSANQNPSPPPASARPPQHSTHSL